MQEKFLDTIFHAYFTEDKNISDYDFLADLSEQVGIMPKDQVSTPSFAYHISPERHYPTLPQGS